MPAFKGYLFSSGLLLVFGIVVGPTRDPFGKEFAHVMVPGLLFLNSLQWFALSIKFRWRITGFLCNVIGAAALVVYGFSPVVDFSDLSTAFLLGMFFNLILLARLTPDNSIRSAFLGEHIAIAFVVLLGFYLKGKGISFESQGGQLATAGFLFWAPLTAGFLWASSTVFKGQKMTQVLVVCGVFQMGIGLFDLGANWNISWGVPSAVGVWLASLLLAAYCFKNWTGKVRNEAPNR